MQAKKRRAVAIPHYTREVFERLVHLDPELEGLSWDEWRIQTSRSKAIMREAGFDVTRVDVALDELLGWLAERGHENDSDGRAAFAAWKAKADG